MIFLPIATRELRLSARKRSTLWLRMGAAVIALLLAAGFLLLSSVTGAGIVNFGRGLFATLTWLTLGAVMSAGLFLTADALSEEKREGTLGFLFLTDLGGFDVVTGKLLATSLRAVFAVLAIFPILGLTLMMGGVTGGQFCRASLALVNALFCSLAAGLLISSISRDSQRAVAGTFLLLLLVNAMGPLLDSVLVKAFGFPPTMRLSSPIYVFLAATAWGSTGFWPGLVTSHLVSWFMLAAAAVLVRRTWQDRRPVISRRSAGRRWGAWGNSAKRGRARTNQLESNPVAWLTFPARWQSGPIWLAALICFGAFAGLMLGSESALWMVWGQVSWILTFAVYVWLAFQACRFLVEARRSGLLELLLVTPLNSQAIVQGQWRAILGAFGLPVAALLVIEAGTTLVAQQTSFGMMSGAANSGPGPAWQWVLASLLTILSTLGTLANFAALVWVGMWMGLTHHNSSLAALKTLVFVQFFPWLAISLISTIAGAMMMFGRMMASQSSAMVFTFPVFITGIAAALTLAKDFAFIFWARRKLRDNFWGVLHEELKPKASPRRDGSALETP